MSDPLVGAPVDPDGPAPQTPAPDKDATPAISVEEFNRLKEDLERERGNIRELRNGWQDEHRRRIELETGYKTLASIRQQEEDARREAAQLQEPAIPWDKFDDPDAMRSTLNEHGRYIESRLLHAMKPYAEAARKAEGRGRLVEATSAAMALRQAREDWERKNYSMDTWDEIEGDFRDYLSGNESGIAAALTPGGGITQAFHFAQQRDLPIQAVSSDTPPVSAGANPASGNGEVLDPVIREEVERMKKTLGLPDFEPTEDLIDEVRYHLRD